MQTVVLGGPAHLDFPFADVEVVEMRMLHWIYGHTRRDRVRNDDIRDRLGVAPIKKKACPTPVEMI